MNVEELKVDLKVKLLALYEDHRSEGVSTKQLKRRHLKKFRFERESNP